MLGEKLSVVEERLGCTVEEELADLSCCTALVAAGWWVLRLSRYDDGDDDGARRPRQMGESEESLRKKKIEFKSTVQAIVAKCAIC